MSRASIPGLGKERAAGGRAYVSVIDWPRGVSRDKQTEALVRSCGIEPFAAGQLTAKPPPMVVSLLAEAAAQSAVNVLHRLGATAFAASEAEMRALPEPLLVKSIGRPEDTPEPMFRCELWRREPVGLLARSVFLIVRGRVRSSSKGPVEVDVAVHREPITGTTFIERTTSRKVDTKLIDIIDLHTRDATDPARPGPRLRINGTKFNFDLLGKLRGFSDNDNADKLALLLAQAAPQAIVDTSFGDFHVPAGVPLRNVGISRTSGGTEKRDEHPLFDFYSAWASLMYQRMLAG
jgi:hypothetical protein